MKKISVVLGVRNEEKNIGKCLESVRNLADEIIVVDENSIDKTVEIAKKYGARVYEEPHHEIFHITKQKALNYATGDWILQLDADEVVTPELSGEIKEVINMTGKQVINRKINPDKRKLFDRHQRLVEKNRPRLQASEAQRLTGREIVAFFIPRVNFFLGKPLIHAGVYPDGVIRLLKKGKAHFPSESVHEQIVIDGKISWLFNNLIHNDSPTLRRYFNRMNRYTSLKSQEFNNARIPKNLFYLFFFSSIKPLFVFLNLFIRHKGFLDGIRGFLWSFLSAMHFPIAYFKYWTGYNKNQ